MGKCERKEPGSQWVLLAVIQCGFSEARLPGMQDAIVWFAGPRPKWRSPTDTETRAGAASEQGAFLLHFFPCKIEV